MWNGRIELILQNERIFIKICSFAAAELRPSQSSYAYNLCVVPPLPLSHPLHCWHFLSPLQMLHCYVCIGRIFLCIDLHRVSRTVPYHQLHLQSTRHPLLDWFVSIILIGFNNDLSSSTLFLWLPYFRLKFQPKMIALYHEFQHRPCIQGEDVSLLFVINTYILSLIVSARSLGCFVSNNATHLMCMLAALRFLDARVINSVRVVT